MELERGLYGLNFESDTKTAAMVPVGGTALSSTRYSIATRADYWLLQIDRRTGGPDTLEDFFCKWEGLLIR